MDNNGHNWHWDDVLKRYFCDKCTMTVGGWWMKAEVRRCDGEPRRVYERDYDVMMYRLTEEEDKIQREMVAPNDAFPDQPCGRFYTNRVGHLWWVFSDGHNYCRKCRINASSTYSLKLCRAAYERTYERDYDGEV